MLYMCNRPIDVGEKREFTLFKHSSGPWWTGGRSSPASEIAASINRLHPGCCIPKSSQICRLIAIEKGQGSCFNGTGIIYSTLASNALKKGD